MLEDGRPKVSEVQKLDIVVVLVQELLKEDFDRRIEVFETLIDFIFAKYVIFNTK